ncbi:MAG TPA: hypothetical protein VED37_16030, partial [Ktedonobacteraceae bacterium]|nr:hypothetical protein [Ktedonobacteraceae bacterium]
MHRPEKPETTTGSIENRDKVLPTTSDIDSGTMSSSFKTQRHINNFDWLTISIIILISAFFAITARFHAQPATSFVPIVVLSATGCGLFVTAMRKLRTARGIGLREAALGGFFMALIQFAVAITYPGIFDSIRSSQVIGNDFLITWILIASFSIILSLAGAAVGHLSFAPQRPSQIESLPRKSSGTAKTNTSSEPIDENQLEETKDREKAVGGSTERASTSNSPRSIINYILIILLIGLSPTIAAYVFSAAYDFFLSFNQFVPGPYPTLRILSALLPWQIPIPIDLNSGIQSIIIFSLLWRIPLFLGNPSSFDLQALEPYILNGAALALLLLTMNPKIDLGAKRFLFPKWLTFLLM